MNPRKQAIQALEEAGFIFHRDGHNHELWIEQETKEIIPVSRSSHFDTEDLKKIQSEIRSILRMKSARRN